MECYGLQLQLHIFFPSVINSFFVVSYVCDEDLYKYCSFSSSCLSQSSNKTENKICTYNNNVVIQHMLHIFHSGGDEIPSFACSIDRIIVILLLLLLRIMSIISVILFIAITLRCKGVHETRNMKYGWMCGWWEKVDRRMDA